MIKNSYRKVIAPLYIINMVIQALLSLLSPIGVMLLFAWLLDKYTAVGSWIYVVFIMLGVFSGLYSMIIFIIKASRALEAIEKQNSERKGDDDGKK